MRVYRIERSKYLESTLMGRGASKTEGYRWNSLDTFMVYTSETRALATLEVSAHLDISEDLPTDRLYIEIDIPNDIEILQLEISDLPKNWDSKPPGLESQLIGDSFIESNDFCVLKVPSAVVPPEYNYLINPKHKDAKKIKITSHYPMKFDIRTKPKSN
ncbi:RES family NAD+ phosphorylase [Pricia sp.]|uniref:RES family NAD+ phosphorylase n=1 Tax=Pricia sp. TaxID=2268138 RepID=UPI003593A9C6